MTRFRLRRGKLPHHWRFDVGLGAQMYAGLVLEFRCSLGPFYFDADVVLWYSPAIEQRSWDRWQAECLAGEHPGVSVSVSTSQP